MVKLLCVLSVFIASVKWSDGLRSSIREVEDSKHAVNSLQKLNKDNPEETIDAAGIAGPSYPEAVIQAPASSNSPPPSETRIRQASRKHGGRSRSQRRSGRRSKSRGFGKSRYKSFGMQACTTPQKYLQRAMFINEARRDFKETYTDNRGNEKERVKSVVSFLLYDQHIKDTVPQTQKLIGWVAKQGCNGTYDNGNGPVCAIVTHKQNQIKTGKYDWYFVNKKEQEENGGDMHGRLCRMDRKSDARRPSNSGLTALIAYSADEGDGKSYYNVLNKDLHDTPTLGKELLLQKWSVFLYWFLFGLDCLKPKTHIEGKRGLFRGMNIGSYPKDKFAAEYTIGRSVVWTGITSTTSDIKLALKEYAKAGPGGPEAAVMFEVQTSLAFPMIPFSKYAYEREYVLPPMSLFEVVENKIDDDGVLWINLIQKDKSIMQDHCIQDDWYVY